MPILRVDPSLERGNGEAVWTLPDPLAAPAKRFFGLGRRRPPPVAPSLLKPNGDDAAAKGKYDHNGLLRFGRKVHSQGAEDGVTEEIFRVIGTRSKWCVEFGAWDGVFLSNTCNLIRNHGWSAVLIEGDKTRCG